MESLHHSVAKNLNESRVGHFVLLAIVGLLAFFRNLSVSLFGETEGLYAAVTETMLRTGEYINLTLNLKPYANKPPMFFWLQGLSSQIFGLTELALRLPTALFSLGTLVVTYWLGKHLFSRTAGFWAALVMGTSFSTVWFGQMGIIDPVLTFFMTLGLLGFATAYFQRGSEWWYVLGFIALAFGTMVKNLHACALPVLLFLALLWMYRDGKPLKSLPFRIGFLIFAILIGAYYALLGPTFWQHFFLQENFKRLTMVAGDVKGSALDAYFGSRPFFWYAFVIWFDFFPWSIFLPTCVLLLWKRRPFRYSQSEGFILFWVAGYFLAFSLFPEKHERYLLPLIPGLALWVGYVYHRVWSSEGTDGRATFVMKIMLGVLSGISLFLVVIGPFFLQKKWGISREVFPVAFQGIIILATLALWYFLYQSQFRTALNVVGALAVVFMVGMVMLIVPAIDGNASPRNMYFEIRSALKNPNDKIWSYQHWDWRTDEDLYYWQHVHPGALILGWKTDVKQGLELLKTKIRKKGPMVILMTEEQYHHSVSLDPDLQVAILKEFLRPKISLLLVSVELKD